MPKSVTSDGLWIIWFSQHVLLHPTTAHDSYLSDVRLLWKATNNETFFFLFFRWRKTLRNSYGITSSLSSSFSSRPLCRSGADFSARKRRERRPTTSSQLAPFPSSPWWCPSLGVHWVCGRFSVSRAKIYCSVQFFKVVVIEQVFPARSFTEALACGRRCTAWWTLIR